MYYQSFPSSKAYVNKPNLVFLLWRFLD